ncbi:MAG TPA: gfo/Idh/MocA family oxidoreductase, partial [Desulfobacteraceae bacterium]|nr:gfo/Idh/MocA family oxidoreductase [Desulfobacteraceae bacterium]
MEQIKTRIGVIGVGHLGEYHVQKYRAHPGVELVGVVDVDRDRVNEIAQRYHTKAYADHRHILDKVDAVSLAVTTEMHFEVAKDVLAEGVHMLIEKPITYDLSEADTLIRMARERDLVLQVGLV